MTDRHVRTTSLCFSLAALLICGAAGGCGGGADSTSPTTPTPNPVSTPPAVTRVTFTLNAEADHFLFSSALARLAAGHSFELTFTAQQVNTALNEQFGHAVEFWLLRTDTPNVSDLRGEGVALSLVWAGNISWIVTSRVPDPGFTATSTRLQIPFAEQRTVRIAHRSDGRAEFAVDGRSVLTLPRSAAEDQVFARVVGARADFSYLPAGAASLTDGIGAIRATPRHCGGLPLCR